MVPVQMSELFNQRSSVEGKIPSGQFNACFDLDSGSWAQDASSTKCLAMDGYFISLFDLRLDRRPLALAAHVLGDVPAAWDPSAIARFAPSLPSFFSPVTSTKTVPVQKKKKKTVPVQDFDWFHARVVPTGPSHAKRFRRPY